MSAVSGLISVAGCFNLPLPCRKVNRYLRTADSPYAKRNTTPFYANSMPALNQSQKSPLLALIVCLYDFTVLGSAWYAGITHARRVNLDLSAWIR